MKIDIDKLVTVSNFANEKKLSRQHVYRLADNEELTLIKINNIAFILLLCYYEYMIIKNKSLSHEVKDFCFSYFTEGVY